MYFYMKKTTALLFAFALLAAVLCTGVSAASGTYRTLYLGTAEQNNMTFAPFDQENATIDSTAPSNESGDMAFGVGDLYYKAQMNAGYENGMVLTFDQPSESLQDTSAGNGYTAEIAFDYRPDRSHALPVKIRFFPQDKSGNVWTGNRVIHLTFTTGADGATTLELYDRSGDTLLGTANLADALGDYTKDADHFFRIRAVFTPTDAAGSLTRSLKLYVDGTLLFDTAYVNNTKEWRIAGFGIQGKTAYLGDLDNLTMCDYIGEPVASDGTVQINDDRAVAAIRRAAVVLSDAQEGDELAAALRDALFFAKQSYAQMTSQSDCDNLAKTLENHITEYANATVLKNLVFSDFTDEDSAMITKDLTLPATYVPPTGGAFDCAFVSDKPDILSPAGNVTRPKYNETVHLTAKLTRDTDNAYLEKTFTLRVLADGEATPLGTLTEGANVPVSSGGKRILLGGYTEDSAPVTISFDGENELAVPGGCEFSAIADLQTHQLILYTDGQTAETKPLSGTPQTIAISGGAVTNGVLVYNDQYGYSTKSLLFATADGQPRSIPVSGGVVLGAQIICKDDTITHAAVLAAVYDGGVLYDTKMATITESANYNEVLTLDFHAALPEQIETATIQLFFLSSLEQLTPIAPQYRYVVSEEVNFQPVIYVAGDSTACNYSDSFFPQTGWGQVLGNFFDSEHVTVSNHAMGGRSAKSFIDEGRLDAIFSVIKPGDYLLIQFGHNDQKEGDLHTDADTTYKEYLTQYVEGARERGAIPILLTSVTRRIYTNGVFDNGNSLGKYPQAARELAQSLDVPLIDMFAYSVDLVNELGEENSKDLFLFIEPNDERFLDDPRFDASRYHKDEATQDNSHFQTYGAEVLASFVAEELDRLNLSLSSYYTPYIPVKP